MSIHIHCNGTNIRCVHSEPLTVHMSGAPVQFTFSEEWDGLGKTAVFRCDGSRDVIVEADGTATVPHEVLTTPGLTVEVGVYTQKEDGTTWPSPTPMCEIGIVREGADPTGDESYPPTPDVGEQAVAAASAALAAAAEAQEVAADIQRRADAGEFDGKDGAQGAAGPAGESGGYYTPTITQPESGKMRVGFIPSKSGMPTVVEKDIELPGGGGGGSCMAVAYVQPDEPEDLPIGGLWYDTDEEQEEAPASGVTSVNGKTGAVTLNAADVGALPQETQIPTVPTNVSAFTNDAGYAKTSEIPAVPAALPNPNKLTFTGAVEAEYDGSAAVSVEIPAGGSGDDGSWRTIADITTEEEIDRVFITQDSGGNAFALTDFVVFVNALANEAGTTSGYFRFGVNPKDAHDYIWQPNGGVTASGYRWYQARFTLLGDKWYCADMIGQVNTSFDSAGGYITRLPDSYSVKTPAAAVVINFMANVGVGTRIMVYGK